MVLSINEKKRRVRDSGNVKAATEINWTKREGVHWASPGKRWSRAHAGGGRGGATFDGWAQHG
jgi:hypothetical protein